MENLKMNDCFELTESPQIQVSVWALRTAEPFKDLFPIHEQVLSDIVDDMNLNGFDIAHPIIVWGNNNMTVVDGHSRLKAAFAAGLDTVPVVCRNFQDEEDAINYAIRSQSSRRNLTNAELLCCVQKLFRPRRGRRSTDSSHKRGKTAMFLAKTLGISCRKVEKLRAISQYGNDRIKEALSKGDYSINRAFEEAMRPLRKQIERNKPDPDAEIIHTMMAKIYSKMNTIQIRKLVKSLQLELATN